MIINKSVLNFLFILTIFSIDRLSKYLIVNLENFYSTNEIRLTSFLNISLIWNEGIAFGLLSFDKKSYYHVLTIIIIFITVIIFLMILKSKSFEKLCFMMIFGGSLGNIFDRVYYSAVPDFIDIHFNNFHWFIFNVADIFISIGVFLLIYFEIFLKKEK